MKKLSFILALVLIFSTFTLPTFAEVADTDEAKIGEVGYATFEEAMLEAAKTGGTVELLKSVTIDSAEGINLATASTKLQADVIVNGNGFTVTSNVSTDNRATFYVDGGHTMTINNMVIETTLSGVKVWGAVISKSANTKVILDGCTVNVRGTAGYGAYGFVGGGFLQLNNTTTKSVFKGFYFYAAGAGTVTATNSTLVAPSIGDTTVASGLTFTETTDPFNEAVASIGSTNYATLAAAFAEAEDGDTITIKKDITNVTGRLNCTATTGVSIILDGNGKTISGTADALLCVFGSANVTIQNLTIESNDATSIGCTLQVNNGAVVTTKNCTLRSNEINLVGSVIIQGGGTYICAEGTTIVGVKSNSAIRTNAATANAYVYGGTLQVVEGATAHNGSGTFKMYGGKTVIGSATTSYNPAMLDGASIRTNANSNGIRFTTSISAELLAHIKSLGADSVSYGTVIFKADSYKALGNATPAAAGWAAGTYMDIPATNGFVGDKENGPFVFNAALTNIQDKNLEVAFGAVSYVEYTVGSEKIRVYSDYNVTDNARKIKDVALAALKDVAAASTNGEYTEGGWAYKYEVAFYYDENGQKVNEKAYSCYTATQYAVVEEIYNRQA
ncbi:MAG: hypothetical protein IJX62_06275, partial [Clostridia bacterium]|nr:hypothetical protein [Clostridia bacterium]